MAEEDEFGEVEEDDSGQVQTSWEFYEPPSSAEVLEKLKALKPQWGAELHNYIDFVQPLPSEKNVAVAKGQKDYRRVWTLYVTVAGRLQMVNDIAAESEWMVTFQPEVNVPAGNPAGFLQYDGDRLVYREYMEVFDLSSGEPRLLGRKPGTAWVPAEGGTGAIGSNRFEKVETSARGRAIAAWGIGILPGSGVASLDEMVAMQQTRGGRREQGNQQQQRREPQRRESRGDVDAELRALLEEYAQVTGISEEEADTKAADFAHRSFGKVVGRPEGGGPLDFSELKDGEVVLFRNRMKSEVAKQKSL